MHSSRQRPRPLPSSRWLLAFATALIPVTQPAHADPASPPTATALRRDISRLLEEGRIDEAVRAVNEALRQAPDNHAVQQEFIALHLALARGWIREERFEEAQTALAAVRTVDPNHADAASLARAIDDARRYAPQHAQSATRWIELEWFEPAFNALRQVIALQPDRRDALLDAYRAAAVGAGDDDYLTKNFHQAFYYYDAAIQLDADQERPTEPSLAARWMQSAAHALATDAARVDYPPAHWKLLHSRLQMLAFPGDAPLRHTIAGLAFEAADQPDRAARCYARAAGQSTDLITNETTSRLRAAAMQRVRQLYDADLTGRRDGIWRQHATGNWQVLEVRRFRIHHRNDAAARRMAAALDFHFARIARRWSLDENEIPWSQPADIFLHADAKSFADATDQPPPVTAVSHIQMQGDRIIAKTIHAHQQDALLLSSSLAHELAHLATAELRRDRPLPAVIAEGLALDMEPACRHRQFARLFAGLPQPSPVARLLTANDLHPPETHFYAEAHRLVTVLRTRTSPAALIAMEFEAFELPRLATRCGFSDAHALQRAYHAARAQPRP